MSAAITVRIDRAALEAAGACERGLALFDALLAHQTEDRARSVGPDGRPRRPLRHLRIRWTPLHALWSAGAYPEFSRWLYARGLIPQISLEGANLEGANLRGANLVDAYLVDAYLDGANLRGAYRPSDPPAGWVPDSYGYLRRSP